MFRRQRHTATPFRLARSGLENGVDHLKRAAGYAMEGVERTMRPRTVAGWGSALATLASVAPLIKRGDQKAEKAKKAKKSKRERSRRWQKAAGLAAAGVAVGAVGAAVRRRRARQWSEYDPEHTFEAVRPTTGSGVIGTASAGAAKAMDATAAGVDKAAGAVSTALDKGSGKVSSAAGAAQDKVSPPATRTAQSPSHNGHS